MLYIEHHTDQNGDDGDDHEAWRALCRKAAGAIDNGVVAEGNTITPGEVNTG